MLAANCQPVVFTNELLITLIIRRVLGVSRSREARIVSAVNNQDVSIAHPTRVEELVKDLVCRVYVYTPHVNGFNNIAASEIDSCKRAHIATLRSSALSRFAEHIVTSKALSSSIANIIHPLSRQPRLFHYHNFL